MTKFLQKPRQVRSGVQDCLTTKHCSPEFWPGGNLLGALLMDLTKDLVQKEEQSNEDDIADDSTKTDDSTNTDIWIQTW